MDLNFSGWDAIILAIAGYVSIVTLVRLMRNRRDEVVNRLQMQVAAEQKRQRAAARKAKRQQTDHRQQVTSSRPPGTADRSAA